MIKYNDLFNDSEVRINKAANDFIRTIENFGIVKEIRLRSVFIIVNKDMLWPINDDIVICVKQILREDMHWDNVSIKFSDADVEIYLSVNELGKDTGTYSNFCISTNNTIRYALKTLNAKYWFPEMVISTGMNNVDNPYSYCAITEYMESNIVSTKTTAIMESPIPFGHIFATALYQRYCEEFPGVLVKCRDRRYNVILMSDSYLDGNDKIATGVEGFIIFLPYYIIKED